MVPREPTEDRRVRKRRMDMERRRRARELTGLSDRCLARLEKPTFIRTHPAASLDAPEWDEPADERCAQCRRPIARRSEKSAMICHWCATGEPRAK